MGTREVKAMGTWEVNATGTRDVNATGTRDVNATGTRDVNATAVDTTHLPAVDTTHLPAVDTTHLPAVITTDFTAVYATDLTSSLTAEYSHETSSNIVQRNRSSTSINEQSSLDAAWLYRTWSDIGGLHIPGLLGVYPPGGYVLDIPGSLQEALASAQYLQNNSWIDEKTRVVIIEATVYTPNINMFVMVTALFEFPQAGVIIGHIDMYPFRLFNYRDTYPISMIVCDWLVYIALGFFGARELFFLYRERLRFFTKFWNIIECINLLISAATIALSVGHAIISDHVSKEANKDQGNMLICL
uniref:Uncharacterized protein n=1 Tax=Biomphalaria glabrata TaxID=6526 RepID=A0A2C9KF85_BIOGL